MPTTSEIAIVDDDESVRQALGNLLRSLGFVVRSFANAEAFLQSHVRGKVACLISDVQMPRMSGLDLQESLSASGDPTPIIFITAFPKDADKMRALAAGATGFLTKPFECGALIACIEKALGTPPPPTAEA